MLVYLLPTEFLPVHLSITSVCDMGWPPPYELHTYTGAWAPSVVVELVTRFARRMSQDMAWSEIQQLLVLINQVPDRSCVCSDLYSVCVYR